MARKPSPTLPLLPMQIMLSLMTWQASPFALVSASDALKSWNNPEGLKKLLAALQKEASDRSAELLSGIERYLKTPYERKVSEPPVIWKRGSTRLLDYGGEGQPVLFVPSLINRYYILDIDERRSFMRYLAESGFHPFVLDWGDPESEETQFGIEHYVRNRLLPASDFLSKTTGERLALAGYCMGGVLSVAAAQLAPKTFSSLSLFATPWDFHCKPFASLIFGPHWQQTINSLIGKSEFIPAESVQALFYMTDPWVFEQKFRRFVAMDLGSPAARDFIALEHWVNDGVAMTSRVALDTLVGWAQNNELAAGRWNMAGKKITPSAIKIPTFIVIPKNDHVVPFDCAWPLTELFKNASILQPSSGHVGMMVGRSARKELWEPFAHWLAALHK